MMVAYFLYGVAVLVLLFPFAVALSATKSSTTIIYGVALVVSALLGLLALVNLARSSQPSDVVLPLGLPWLGVHFRIDALSAFFLFVVNLGGAAASLFALGYGRHEEAPHRVLPFYAAY